MFNKVPIIIRKVLRSELMSLFTFILSDNNLERLDAKKQNMNTRSRGSC